MLGAYEGCLGSNGQYLHARRVAGSQSLTCMIPAQAIKVLNMIKVFGKPIRVNKASQDKKTQDIGANLFIGNIDPDVDEKVALAETEILNSTVTHCKIIGRLPAIRLTIVCDMQLLYDTFSAFGMIIQTPKIMRDPETGASRGFGFVSYEGFEASDAAIEAMNGQFLCNRYSAHSPSA